LAVGTSAATTDTHTEGHGAEPRRNPAPAPSEGAGESPQSCIGTCQRLWRDTWRCFRLALVDLRQGRFWGFCFTFSWAALTQQWAGSAVGSGLLFPDAGEAYHKWAVPLLVNASYVVSPLCGLLIDRTGFIPAAILLITASQCTTGLLWIGGGAAQWLSLVSLATLAGITYTVQFSYLTMEFDGRSYPGLLTVTLAVQGCLGFIAWPLLSVVKPFGCADPCTGNFLFILAPSVLLYAWPIWLARLRFSGGRTTQRLER
jgi:hypothetical protein